MADKKNATKEEPSTEHNHKAVADDPRAREREREREGGGAGGR